MYKAALLLLLLLNKQTSADKQKIAVIGGGIGGTSTAYFLSQLFDKDAIEVKVFEGSQVGGRLRKLDIGGRSYDSGGSIIASGNFYAKVLTEKVGLTEELLPSGSMGLYDGSKYVLKLTGSPLKDKFKVVARYGFGIRGIVNEAESMVTKFNRLYCLQNSKVAYRTVGELLNSTHPDLFYKTTVDMKTVLTKMGFSELIQNEIVTAILHTNYNQNTSVNAFVGFVSLVGGFAGKLWRVKEGNHQLPGKVLEKSGAELVMSKVNSISKSGDRFLVKYTTSTGSQIEEEFDSVVLATPLHNADITFDGITVEHQSKPFQTTIATFVNGVMSPLVEDSDNPDDIMVTSNIFFSSIGKKGDADTDFNYKIFSKKELTKDQLDKLFKSIHDIKVVRWKAYPKYKVPDSLPNFEITPGLFYLNAIESAASAIEMSCIGAKNAALLVYHYLNKSSVSDVGICGDTKVDWKKFKDEL